MIDLIGFWFIVTVIPILMAIPVAAILYVILELAAEQAMPKESAKKFCEFFYREEAVESPKSPPLYYCDGKRVTKETYDRRKRSNMWYCKMETATITVHKVLGVTVPHLGVMNTVGIWMWLGMVGSILIAGFYQSLSTEWIWYSFVDVTVWYVTRIDFLAGYVGILVGFYLVLVAILKVFYKGSVFVSKVNDHINDKEKHNEEVL